MTFLLLMGALVVVLFGWIVALGGLKCEGCETSKRGAPCTCYENESGYRW